MLNQLWQSGGGGVADHGALTGLSDDDHAQYLLLAGRAGGQTAIGGTLTTEALILQDNAVDARQLDWSGGALTPDTDAAYDLGATAFAMRTLYCQNNNGRVIQCTPAQLVGAKTTYEIGAGGGHTFGGDFIVQFESIQLGTAAENQYIIDFGPVDFVAAEHRYIFRSLNAGFIGDISVETKFSGALGGRNIGFDLISTGSFQYFSVLNNALGPAMSAGYRFRSGNNTFKRFEIQFDGVWTYRINSSQSWHHFLMPIDNLVADDASFSTMRIKGPNDQLNANRTGRATLTLSLPGTNLNGYTLGYATALNIIGQPAIAGAINSAIFIGASGRLILSNVATGSGPSFQGVAGFAGFDILLKAPTTATANWWDIGYPSGTATSAVSSLLNDANLFGGTYAQFERSVAGAVANLLCRESAAPVPITELNIGGDATSGLTDINFDFVGATRIKFQTALITLSDALDIAVGTATGTKIATAAAQKLGFWGAAPVVRAAAYTPTNVTTDRSYDANATTINELADVLGTLIADLQGYGLLA